MTAPHTPQTVSAGDATSAGEASGQEEHPWYTGGGALEDIAGIKSAIDNGSWVQGGLSTVSLVADTASMFIDPLGTALSWGVGIIMDHCDPLRGWLQKLAGNKDEVLAKANTWRNIACQLEENAKRLDTNVASFTQYSRGQAANAFTKKSGGVSTILNGAAMGARGLAEGLNVLASIVDVVYSMVRDAISQIIGTFISAVIQAVLTAGLALAELIPEITAKVGAWATKLGASIKDLVSSAGKLKNLFTHGREAINSLMTKIKEGFAGIKTAARDAKSAKGSTPHEPHTPKTPRERYSSPVEVDPSSVRTREDLLRDAPKDTRDPGLPDAVMQEGRIDGLSGADFVRKADDVCGYAPDGTPRNYEAWNRDNRIFYVDKDGVAEEGTRWPIHEGYKDGVREYSTAEEYAAEHGLIVDRIGNPRGGYLGAVEDGHVATFEERALAPGSVHDPYYQYQINPSNMPEGWKIEHGTAAPWQSEVGGARQLRILDAKGNPKSVADLLDLGILQGVEVPVGLR